MKEKVLKELNDQMNREMFSSYLYLSMAAYFEAEGLTGFASWMEAQAREEWFHAMKFYNFIHERNSRVALQAIEEPKFEWKSPLDAFKEAYKHEQFITGHINSLVDLAVKEKDHATQIFLQWFVTEQVEEESSVDNIVTKLEMVSKAPHGLYMLDRELGGRGAGGGGEEH